MAKCCSIVGTLKKRVTIQALSREADGQGGFTETWADVATVWASIEPVKAYERFQAQQLAVPVSHKIMMRYRGDVTAASRLVYQGRVFNVKEAINVDEDSRFLSIRALETESLEYVETYRILLEDGFALLLEDGSNLLQEAA